ncbi:hypothetical protein K3N28_05115 [Glycomyces sp. TRM65418]|uniref:hypothetical protein n=1 Tax=Glycomyces sp. TRM65418 TaxID=2867006 RepID=UPI001CE6555D|nr:hypothetical protein [Glycomyces sp. TRM65418]MCC3762448.1 hypothetical protein [Glycomyces sp. TRM65418]QZD56492.1 hypothetical protein K3N28_05075 [Glycomyces sp. TRM65418]
MGPVQTQSPTFVLNTDAELEDERAQLVDELTGKMHMSFDEVRECAEDWALRADELSLWEAIRSIDFLLGHD